MADQNKVVLFMDSDTLVLRAILSHYRRNPKISALGALSVRSAMKLMESTHVDVVVSGLRMPPSKGSAFFHAMSRRHLRTSYIVVDGILDPFWLKRACQMADAGDVLARSNDCCRNDRAVSPAARHGSGAVMAAEPAAMDARAFAASMN